MSDAENFDPKAFVDSVEWTFAKTMADIPHEYIVKGKPVDEDQYMAFAEHIWANGVDLPFRGHKYRYLFLGDHKYWLMAPPKYSRIINRASADAPE